MEDEQPWKAKLAALFDGPITFEVNWTPNASSAQCTCCRMTAYDMYSMLGWKPGSGFTCC